MTVNRKNCRVSHNLFQFSMVFGSVIFRFILHSKRRFSLPYRLFPSFDALVLMITFLCRTTDFYVFLHHFVKRKRAPCQTEVDEIHKIAPFGGQEKKCSLFYGSAFDLQQIPYTHKAFGIKMLEMIMVIWAIVGKLAFRWKSRPIFRIFSSRFAENNNYFGRKSVYFINLPITFQQFDWPTLRIQ